MTNTQKQILIITIFFIIDVLIAFSITSLLGIKNTVIIQSFTATGGDITFEVIISLLLLLVESTFLDYISENKKFF